MPGSSEFTRQWKVVRIMAKKIRGWVVCETEGHRLAVEKKEDIERYRALMKLRDEIRQKTRLRPKVTFTGLAGLLYTGYLEGKVDSIAGIRSKSIWELARFWGLSSISISKRGRYLTGAGFKHNGYEVDVDPEAMTLTIMPTEAIMLFEARAK